MRLVILSACSAWLLTCAASAAEPPIPIQGHKPVLVHGPARAARDLIAVELAFDRRAQEVGAAQAMREYMDRTDGLSFVAAGEPARGADAIYQAHGGDKQAGRLTWYPSEVFVSEAGDMGATWGHFTLSPPAGKRVEGRYVTVWRKQGGKWRGIIDIGNPD